MHDNRQALSEKGLAQGPVPPVLAPVLMMVFWMLLGSAGGIRLMEGIWRFIDLRVGEFSIVVPVGGIVGAIAGGLLGMISNPRLQVLLMAMFAGAAAGAVAGKLPWGDIGEIGGQIAGGMVGGAAWGTWMVFGRRQISDGYRHAIVPTVSAMAREGTKTDPGTVVQTTPD